ncbi:hypothetical protein AGMMS49573_02580 [Endomicrobiia bacterium]|nr:hypothetical protein AGMMS49571_02740 [Endomicrobiia bacterium]GHT15624.1 hypothetical protein AGMMS49573_02580 [Endomicrobiia bacterium]GHT19764.1 hypothetical protein AGMMS49929_04280 [Endomicrobiia bacterium]GHT24696.1 hypothetical protein AGMMS49953_07770 [Endomicrobiia bacterium]GHT26623.1 hypothetical protein AGMMS49995_03680 [Endomicrobiia bacterium]
MLFQRTQRHGYWQVILNPKIKIDPKTELFLFEIASKFSPQSQNGLAQLWAE